MNWSLIRAIAFDLDDTLVDRHQLMVDWLRHDLDLQDHSGIHELDDRGYGPRRPFFRALADRSGIPELEIARRFSHEMPRHARPMSGVVALLERLRNQSFPFALASNGTGLMQRGKLAAAALTSHFPIAVISGEIGHEKPSHNFYAELVSCLGVSPDAILMVGDHPTNDIIGAGQAGLRTCWLRNGYRAPPATVDFIIDRLEELPLP